MKNGYATFQNAEFKFTCAAVRWTLTFFDNGIIDIKMESMPFVIRLLMSIQVTIQYSVNRCDLSIARYLKSYDEWIRYCQNNKFVSTHIGGFIMISTTHCNLLKIPFPLINDMPTNVKNPHHFKYQTTFTWEPFWLHTKHLDKKSACLDKYYK